MRIKTMGAGPHPDISIVGNTVTINEHSIDCESRQGDSAQIIDIRQQGGQVNEGGSGHQLASIHIPACQYEEVDTGETDDESNPIIAREKLAFNSNKVLVTLWTYNK